MHDPLNRHVNAETSTRTRSRTEQTRQIDPISVANQT
jgi:hypothetical protein